MGLTKKDFPEGTKFVIEQAPRHIGDNRIYSVVIEKQPGIFILPFAWRGKTIYKKLSLPYVVLILSYYPSNYAGYSFDLYCRSLFFRTKPLTGINNKLYIAGLPNIGDGRLCSGNKETSSRSSSVKDWISAAHFFHDKEMECFFNRGFKYREIDEGVRAAKYKGTFKNITDWVRKTKKDPSWVMKNGVWPISCYSGLKDYLQRCTGMRSDCKMHLTPD